VISVTLEKLRKAFGSTVAVDGVTLEAPPGGLTFLVGPSGCGKTTILRMIAGFIEPTAGVIRFGSRDVTGLPAEKRECGMVFQGYALWPHMTVRDNVAFGLDVRGVKGQERARRVDEALAMVRMEQYADRKPNQLSGGQQQRVALARAIVFRPRVLLLDEPLSNLDAKLRLEMRHEIRRIWVVDKHELEDSLPRIYQEVTGRPYPGEALNEHSAFGAEEISQLREVCGSDNLHFEMVRELLSTEQRHRNMARRAGLFEKLEDAIKRGFYDSADDAKERAVRRQQAKEQTTHAKGLPLKMEAP
jgi:ABC-type nitrate/sulfonate/bicarbonate transport system ATPase subunit